jgi:WD40 repeat protein
VKRELKSLSSRTYVSAIAFTPDGSRIAMAADGLKVWSLATVKVEKEIDSSEQFKDVAYSPDGHLLAGAAFAGGIAFWDPASGARSKTLSGHRGEIHRIRFSPDERLRLRLLPVAHRREVASRLHDLRLEQH